MFCEIPTAGELTPVELRERYDAQLATVIEEHGVDRVGTELGVERETAAALAAGESPTLTLEAAAAILAIDDREPDAASIVAETCDHLIVGMTSAVLDVDAIESDIDRAFDAREIRRMIEGRLRMTVDELALLHSYIDGQRS